ncbi:hypothetical protein B0I37DRAFT_360973 [Chaetomium sp. MPI-CAGE-AT-0009]|nr:hypothetical protein B0I37DRAFT_360973 [Chaetomium sp. MPI-CAGE-AT-0009]
MSTCFKRHPGKRISSANIFRHRSTFPSSPVTVPTPASSTGRLATPEPTFCTVDVSKVPEEVDMDTDLRSYPSGTSKAC